MPDAAAGRWARLRWLLGESPGLGRLLTVKLISIFGDGIFQAALAGVVLFSPERGADPRAIAAGFAVLLLPYSIIGPFAGGLLDRWDRRSVLLWANLLRAVFIVLCAGALAIGAPTAAVLLLALCAVGVSRFVAAGISAALPHVVSRRLLVPANSVFATIGSVVNSLGASTGLLILGLVGAGDRVASVVVLFSVIGSFGGAAVAASFARHALGPERASAGAPAMADTVLHSVLSGLGRGAVAVWRAPSVTGVLLAIGAHRIVFGVDTLVMVLILRGPLAGEDGAVGGLAGFGVAVGLTAAGMLLAAVATPVLLPRLGRALTVLLALAVALAVQLLLVAALAEAPLLAAAFLLGLAGQTIKLTGDAAMQTDIRDARRGQVFALQDTMFNMAFVLAIAAAAAIVPADGQSRALILAVGGFYALAIVGVLVNAASRPTPTNRLRATGYSQG
nr:MFS transporter [Tomitella biformata]